MTFKQDGLRYIFWKVAYSGLLFRPPLEKRQEKGVCRADSGLLVFAFGFLSFSESEGWTRKSKYALCCTNH